MEQQLFGHPERERSAGYEPMPLAHPLPRESFDDVPAAAPDSFAPLSPKEAAEMLRDPANRPPHIEPAPVEQPPIPIEYLEQGGARAGQRMDDQLTVSAEQAAADLAGYRQGIDQVAAAAEAQSIRDAIQRRPAKTR
jgi:hypothetical protein